MLYVRCTLFVWSFNYHSRLRALKYFRFAKDKLTNISNKLNKRSICVKGQHEKDLFNCQSPVVHLLHAILGVIFIVMALYWCILTAVPKIDNAKTVKKYSRWTICQGDSHCAGFEVRNCTVTTKKLKNTTFWCVLCHEFFLLRSTQVLPYKSLTAGHTLSYCAFLLDFTRI